MTGSLPDAACCNRNACFFRGTRAGADDQILRFQGFDFFDGDLSLQRTKTSRPTGKVLTML